MTMTVNSSNDAPVLTTAKATLTNGTEDITYTITQASLLTGFSDIDDNPLTVTGLTATNGTLSTFNATTQSWTFTPNTNFNGTVSLSYNVTDGIANTAATQSFSVTAVNDAPTASNRITSTNEDTTKVFALTDFGFSDIDAGNTLQSVTISSLTTTGSLKLNGTVVTVNQVISAADITAGKLAFTPATNGNGNNYASFGFKVSDGTTVSTNAYTMTFNVTAVNDAPVLTTSKAALANGTEDTAYAITKASLLTGYTDVDGNPLSVIGLTASNGTLSTFNTSTQSWTFTPNTNFNGTVNLSYNVTDGIANTAATQSFSVTAVNDAPTATGVIANQEITVGSVFSITLPVFQDVDAADQLSYNMTQSDGSALPAWLSFNAQTRVLSGTPLVSDVVNALPIKVVVSDLAGASVVLEFNLAVVVAPDRFLIGDQNNNTLNGGGGNDTLDGGLQLVYSGLRNDDTLNGGTGDDSFRVRGVFQSGSYNGGTGSDTLDFSQAVNIYHAGSTTSRSLEGNVGVLVNLSDAAIRLSTTTSPESDRTAAAHAAYTYYYGTGVWTDDPGHLFGKINISTIENATGTQWSDYLIGDAGNNILDGGFSTDQTVQAGGTARNHDSIQAGAGDDTILIRGVFQSGTYDGGTGTDTLDFSRVEDTFGIYGDGSKRSTYDAGVRVELTTGTVSNFYNQTTHTDWNDAIGRIGVSNIENVTGTDYQDKLAGNSAANVLNGGKGNDILIGGLGNDTFVFSSALSTGNVDTIGDFLSGTDKIALGSAIFAQLFNDTNLSDNLVVGGTGVKAIDANDYLIYNSFSKGLFYDADGSGAGTAVQFATLNNVNSLNANDFVVI